MCFLHACLFRVCCGPSPCGGCRAACWSDGARYWGGCGGGDQVSALGCRCGVDWHTLWHLIGAYASQINFEEPARLSRELSCSVSTSTSGNPQGWASAGGHHIQRLA